MKAAIGDIHCEQCFLLSSPRANHFLDTSRDESPRSHKKEHSDDSDYRTQLHFGIQFIARKLHKTSKDKQRDSQPNKKLVYLWVSRPKEGSSQEAHGVHLPEPAPTTASHQILSCIQKLHFHFGTHNCAGRFGNASRMCRMGRRWLVALPGIEPGFED